MKSIVLHHTLNPHIANRYGTYGSKHPETDSVWDNVSVDEAHIPFINQMDSGRAILAVK